MPGRLIEAGLLFLLFFTPLAFGGVKEWAVGVIQVAAGMVLALWIWSRGETAPRRDAFLPAGHRPRRLTGVLAALGLFFAWVAFQAVPLPAGAVARLAPATHDLYARTLPGYEAGLDWTADDLEPWLRARHPDPLSGAAGAPPPGPVGGSRAAAGPSLPAADPAAAGVPGRMGAWRSLSLDPWRTRRDLTLFLCYGALFVVAADFLRRRERLQRLLSAVVLCGAGVSLLGILQRLGAGNRVYWIWPDPSNDPFGPFFNRNNYAAFALTTLPLALGLALSSFQRWKKGRSPTLSEAALFGLAAVVTAGGVGMSLSRGGILSMGIALGVLVLVLFALGRRGAEMGLLAAILLLAGLFVAWTGYAEFVHRLGSLSEGMTAPSLAGRAVAWRHAAGLASDHLVTGTGLGTFQLAFRRYTPPGRDIWHTAHNEYLELLCDVGLIGTLLLLTAAAFYLRRILRPSVLRRGRAPYVFAGLVAGLAGILAHSMVSANLQVPAVGVLVALLMGALAALVAREEARQAVRRASRSGTGRPSPGGAPA